MGVGSLLARAGQATSNRSIGYHGLVTSAYVCLLL